MNELEMLRQNYRDKPCFETRYNLARALYKAGAATQDKSQGFGYFSEAAELLEENYSGNPCYETRRQLAVIYEKLGDTANANFSNAKDFYFRAAELFEINLAEQSDSDTRKRLSLLYGKIIFITDTTQPDANKEVRYLYLKKAVLDEANYSESPDKDTVSTLGNTYSSLASIILKDDSAEAIAEAEKWLTAALELREKYFAENPDSPHAKMTLVRTYKDLASLEIRKGTPEGNAQSELWKEKIDKLITRPKIS